MEFINKLRPITYNLNTQSLDDFIIQDFSDSIKAMHQAGMEFASSTARIHSGFIAQEVEQAAQELGFKSSIVSSPSHEKDLYAVNYAEIVVPLVKAVQELSKHNDSLTTVNAAQDTVDSAFQNQVNQLVASNVSLQEQINSLQDTTADTALQTQVNQLAQSNALLQEQVNALMAMVNNCCAANNEGRSFMGGFSNPSQITTPSPEGRAGEGLNVQLSNKNIVVLEQNVPNPFAEQTTISYNIPTTVTRAQIVFFDLSGQIIKSVEISEKGTGQLNVFASDLSSGIYTYSLIADGVAIETKKMVKR